MLYLVVASCMSICCEPAFRSLPGCPKSQQLHCFRLVAPGPGIWAAKKNLQMVSTFGIFVISGLGLKRSQAMQALKSWKAALFGFISILVLSPLAGFAALRLPLQPPELAFGLAVFCCMPCTLSSGVSLTQVSHPRPVCGTVGEHLLHVSDCPAIHPRPGLNL